MNLVQCARYYKQRRWFFIIARCRKQVVLERPPHIFITINFIRTNAKTFGRLMIQWCFFLSIVDSRKICYNFIFSLTINLHQCAFPKNYYLSYWGRIFTALIEINKKNTLQQNNIRQWQAPKIQTTRNVHNLRLKCFGQQTNSTPEKSEIPQGNSMAKLRICIPRSWQAAAPVWFHLTNGQHLDALWMWSNKQPSGTNKASDWNGPSEKYKIESDKKNCHSSWEQAFYLI